MGFFSIFFLDPHFYKCHLKHATTHDSFKRMYKKEYFYAPTWFYCTTGQEHIHKYVQINK